MTTSIRVLDRAESETSASNSVGRESDWVDALRDLEGADEEAQEKEYPAPSETAKKNARRLMREMYEISPRRYEVYPGPNGEMVIEGFDESGQSITVFCDSDDSVLCLADTRSGERSAKYASANDAPDGLLANVLAEFDGSRH